MKTPLRTNRPIPNTNLVEVPLTRGRVAIIDASDAALISGRNWQAKPGHNTSYACGKRSLDPYSGNVGMHRLIMGITDPNLEVHHVNGDGLDNRRCNLIVLTKAEHRRLHRRQDKHLTSSRYTYVSRVKDFVDGSPKWRASVASDESLFLGDHRDEKLAAEVGDLGALYLYGASTYTNFATWSDEARKLAAKYIKAHEVPRANMTSAYKGVTYVTTLKRTGETRWVAQYVISKGCAVRLYCKTEEEAARTYDAMVILMRGSSAPRNFRAIPKAYMDRALEAIHSKVGKAA